MMALTKSISRLRWSAPAMALIAGSAGCDVLPTGSGRVPGESTGASLLVGASLYVDPTTGAARQADEWRASRPLDAALMDKIASEPHAVWLGDWSGDVRSAADRVLDAAAAAAAVPVLVLYNIPHRDCGGLSGGGGATADEYHQWISAVADGIGGRAAVVILEPDALAAMDCLAPADADLRTRLIREATTILKRGARTAVYLDAGQPRWQSAAVISDRLLAAGIAAADGFSLNVSNFVGDQENEAYGAQISGLVGGKHFVVDSGRNGAGAPASGEWCNADGRALGRRPTTRTHNPLVDAFLWIKRPGESDGACNGGPPAGQWWADYALGLARRASY